VAMVPRTRAPSMIVGMGSSAGSLIPLGARSFGKYELLARLATGGMAEIFLARPRDPSAHGSVLVIKRVLPHLAEDARFVAMFRDEARLAARIEHDNVCRVLDLGSVGETYFIALEYLHGVPLSRVLVRAARAGRPLDIRLAAGLIAQCCAGLHHAHELRGSDGVPLDVVHRDISPPNIFVTASGAAKVLDFGVAKAQGASEKTRTGTVKGKNAYMSPEQVRGQPMDRRSDLFSLGIVLWEALTAQRLFMREVDFETFRAITQGDVPDVRSVRPEVPAELAEVVQRSLALHPDDRYASALELGDAIVASLAGMGGPASEREISSFVRKQFVRELNAREQLLTATATSAPSQRADTIPDEPTGTPVQPEPGEPEIRWSVSRKSQPMPRLDHEPMARVTSAMPRVTSAVPRMTGAMPRVDAARSRTGVFSPVGTRPLDLSALDPSALSPGGPPDPTSPPTTIGPAPAPVQKAPVLELQAVPPRRATVAMQVMPTTRVRALPLPAPPQRPVSTPGTSTSTHVRPATQDSGHEAAAAVFIVGLVGLLAVLWWLL
jgi:eukaryotic-like serine/threonine-protein kinase